MAALEVLTNEGAKALSLAAASGPRLVIEFACVGDKSDFGVESSGTYVGLTATRLAAWGTKEGDSTCTMSCTALLPSQVAYDESSDEAVEAAQLEPRNALDAEFSWLPSVEKEFDAIAVFARLYYGYSEYATGSYAVGDIVWYRGSDGTTAFYRCTAAVTVTSVGSGPASDLDHWTSVTMTDKVIGQNPPMRAASDSLILLHVSTTEQPIKVAQGMELDYKLRIFLNSESFDLADKDTCPVYLESLVPAGSAALQLGFLKEMAETMASMRQVIADAYSA